MLAGDSSFGDDNMEMMEIMMLSTCNRKACSGVQGVQLKRTVQARPEGKNMHSEDINQVGQDDLPIALVTTALKLSHTHEGHHQDYAEWICTLVHHCRLQAAAFDQVQDLQHTPIDRCRFAKHTVWMPHFRGKSACGR